MSFVDDLKHFLDKTTDNVESLVESLVDPTLSKLKSQFASLTSQYNATRSSLLDRLAAIQDQVNLYKQFLGYQTALLLIARSVHWSDEEFSKLLQDADQDAPSLDLSHALFLEPRQTQELTQCLGSSSVLPIFHSLSTYELLGDNLLSGTLREISTNVTFLSELQMEQYKILIPSLASAPLLHALLDDILSKENEYREAISRLQAGIQKLNDDIARIQRVDKSLDKAIEDFRVGFIYSMSQLDRIQKASFNWQLQPDDSDKAYLCAMSSAASQYGILMKLRLDWQRISENSGEASSYLSFVQDEIMRRDPRIHTAKQIQQFITLIRQSSDTLTKAWEKEGCPESSI